MVASYVVTKKAADKVMSFDSKSRGVVFLTDYNYLLDNSKDSIGKVEARLAKLGYPLKFKEISASTFYPTGLRVLVLMVIKEVLKLSDEDIKNMGSEAPKISLLIKLMLKFFVSLKTAANKAPLAWEKHHTKGKLIVKEVNEKKKYIITRLVDFNTEPVFLSYLEGYFRGFINFALPGKKVKAKLTKAMYKGDDYNEFRLFW